MNLSIPFRGLPFSTPGTPSWDENGVSGEDIELDISRLESDTKTLS